MRRFGDPESFLDLLDQIRALAPLAGVRSNVIVGFPGETEDDLQTLCDFLEAARMDVTGVFGYSDEDGTEAAASSTTASSTRTRSAPAPSTSPPWSRSSTPSGPRSASARRWSCSSSRWSDGVVEGRADHQGPEVDGTTMLTGADGARSATSSPRRSSPPTAST